MADIKEKSNGLTSMPGLLSNIGVLSSRLSITMSVSLCLPAFQSNEWRGAVLVLKHKGLVRCFLVIVNLSEGVSDTDSPVPLSILLCLL